MSEIDNKIWILTHIYQQDIADADTYIQVSNASGRTVDSIADITMYTVYDAISEVISG